MIYRYELWADGMWDVNSRDYGWQVLAFFDADKELPEQEVIEALTNGWGSPEEQMSLEAWLREYQPYVEIKLMVIQDIATVGQWENAGEMLVDIWEDEEVE